MDEHRPGPDPDADERRPAGPRGAEPSGARTRESHPAAEPDLPPAAQAGPGPAFDRPNLGLVGGADLFGPDPSGGRRRNAGPGPVRAGDRAVNRPDEQADDEQIEAHGALLDEAEAEAEGDAAGGEFPPAGFAEGRFDDGEAADGRFDDVAGPRSDRRDDAVVGPVVRPRPPRPAPAAGRHARTAPAPATPPAPADRDPTPVSAALYDAGGVPERGTLAGIHVEQLLVWQVVVVALLLVRDARVEVLAAVAAGVAVLLLLTATRMRGQWTYRHLVDGAWRRSRRRDEQAFGPQLTIQDARLGRRRRLACVFDGEGWSSAIRLTPGGGANRLPLGAVVLAVEQFLADGDHRGVEIQIVHTVIPPGRDSAFGPLPPVAAPMWLTTRVHGVRAPRVDRPLPDLPEIRRDLRRAVDGLLVHLVENGVDAQALTARELYVDCVLSSGGRREGPEPAALPRPVTPADERAPARAIAAREAAEGAMDCESVEIDTHTDLGDATHAVLALDGWPSSGFGEWLDGLGDVAARTVSVAVTLSTGDEGCDAEVVVRATTGTTAGSADVLDALEDAALAVGARPRQLPVASDEALIATLPLGSSAAQRALGRVARHAVGIDIDAEFPPLPAGLVIGAQADGWPLPMPLLGPEPVWFAVVGDLDVAAAVVAAAVAADLPVQVVTLDPHHWRTVTGALRSDRLDVRSAEPDGAVVPMTATPGVLLLDDVDHTTLRPVLRPWQAGFCRVDPDLAGGLPGVLHGVDRVLVARCDEARAREVCAAFGLDDGWLTGLLDVPDGMVAVADHGGVREMFLDPDLLATAGVRSGRRAMAAG